VLRSASVPELNIRASTSPSGAPDTAADNQRASEATVPTLFRHDPPPGLNLTKCRSFGSRPADRPRLVITHETVASIILRID
jgi:hypothetical protein